MSDEDAGDDPARVAGSGRGPGRSRSARIAEALADLEEQAEQERAGSGCGRRSGRPGWPPRRAAGRWPAPGRDRDCAGRAGADRRPRRGAGPAARSGRPPAAVADRPPG